MTISRPRGGRHLVLIAAVLTLASLLGMVLPADAAGAPESTGKLTFSDPRHDGANDRGPGDITAVTVVNKSTIRLATTVRRGVDPRSADAFQEQGSFLAWYLRLDDAHGTENTWQVTLTGDGHGGLTGFFQLGSTAVACSVTRTYSSNTYTVRFARSCLGEFSFFRAQARTAYRPVGASILETTFDQAPTGFTSKVFPAP